MNSCVLLVVLLLGLCYGEDKDFQTLNLKYHVSTDSALINCKSAGMELASLTSETEQKNLEKFLKQQGYDKGYWLSGTNLGNGDFTWVSTGNPVIYTKWLPNQPDNAKLAENNLRGENCIQWGMHHTSANSSGWNDLFCGYKLPYICQETEYCNKIN